MPAFSKDMIARLRRERFDPRFIGLLANPFFLIRRPLHSAIRSLSSSVTGSILDFGCGSKPYRDLFLHAEEYIGLDIEKSGHDHSNSEIDVFYDGRSIPFEDDRFDGVVSFEVFEHVFNLGEMLVEIRRVLRPGGRLLCSLPFGWDEHEAPYDFGRYTSFGIRHVLEEAGLEVKEVRKSGNYVSAVSQLWIAYLAQHISPRRGLLKYAFQLLIISPFSLMGWIGSRVLPQSDQFFSNLIVLAEKPGR